MLRERVPRVVNLALKYCKKKEAWLQHVYKNWIWVYSDKEERLKATRLLLGYSENKKTQRNFVFNDTIAWDNLSEEESKEWRRIKKWVVWFMAKYAYIEDDYKKSKLRGRDIYEIKFEIMCNYLMSMCPTDEDDAETVARKNRQVNELVDFLIDSFEHRI